LRRREEITETILNEAPKIHKIAFIGDHLPRKCGIATFTSDLLAAAQSAHSESRCLAVSVNDIPDGYEYPDVVRFEVTPHPLCPPHRSARRTVSANAASTSERS